MPLQVDAEVVVAGVRLQQPLERVGVVVVVETAGAALEVEPDWPYVVYTGWTKMRVSLLFSVPKQHKVVYLPRSGRSLSSLLLTLPLPSRNKRNRSLLIDRPLLS